MTPSLQSFLDSPSDLDSDLSEPPEDFNNMQSSLEAELKQISLESPCFMHSSKSGLKRKSATSSQLEGDWANDAGDADNYRLSRFKKQRLHNFRSQFEDIPIEVGHVAYNDFDAVPDGGQILNLVVSYLVDDRDLVNLIETCTRFARALAPASSAIWKERFLSRYDYAYVRRPTEYAIAYQLRRLVLAHFVPFTTPNDRRLAIQLEVLKDMILETYLQPRPHLDPPLTSRNLAVFASPGNSPWMRIFLSCFFFPKPGRRYGQPHAMFDAVQLVFSHLLLSPESKMAHVIDSSRENYNLAVVYNWDKPFSTLFRRLPEENEGRDSVHGRRQRELSNLRPRKSTWPFQVEAPKAKYELDTHALLHIRNFWHRHLIDDSDSDSARLIGSRQMGVMGENTYAKMARHLRSAGIAAKMWERPLKDDMKQMATEWYGHWSCVHPWPRKRQELEEMQSCAEDWESIDPMKLDFSTTTNNQVDGFWSPIFSAIPAFAKTIPESGPCVFIRGLAPFVELPSWRDGKSLASTSTTSQSRSYSHSQATLTTPRLPKYHPYLSLRLRGVIHSIPSQPTPETVGLGSDADGIPGWSRIVMVLYKPSKRYLIQVLEHAEEEYGGQFGPVVTSQLLQTAQAQAQAGQQAANPGAGQAADVDASELEAQLESYLRQKLVSKPEWRDPARMDREVIEDIEEKFRLSEFLDWNDMDYAYAYEGVILPGGKIMMGRWWRCGMFGQGDGLELGADGQPVDLGLGLDSTLLASDGDNDGDVDGGQTPDTGIGMSVDRDGDGDGDGVGVTITTGLGHEDGDSADPTNNTDDNESETESPVNVANANANAAGSAARDKKLERGPFVFWC